MTETPSAAIRPERSWSILGLIILVLTVNLYSCIRRPVDAAFEVALPLYLFLFPVFVLTWAGAVRRAVQLVAVAVLLFLGALALRLAGGDDPAPWDVVANAILNVVIFLAVQMPVFYFQLRVMQAIQSQFVRQYGEKEEELRRLNAEHERQKARNQSMERKVEFINDSYGLMEQIVRTLEPVELYEAIRKRICANFSFDQGHLVLMRLDEDGVNSVSGVVCLKGDISLTPASLPPTYAFILNRIRERRYEGSLPDIERDNCTMVVDGETRQIVITSSALVTGGHVVGVLLLVNLSFAEQEVELKLQIYSQQLALGLERISLYKQVEEKAITDNLTGLFVHRYFQKRLEEECVRALRSGSSLSLLMIDIDHFKKVNDQYGHLTGDIVLKKVAANIKISVRDVDFVARYGGEEIAAILLEIDPDAANATAERIRSVVEKYPEYPVKGITISIGVASLPLHALSKADLLAAADAALYRAKQTGRNRICVAPPLAAAAPESAPDGQTSGSGAASRL